MELLEVLKSKEIDIYISLFMTLLGLVLGLIIDSFKQRNLQGENQVNCQVTSITVNNIVKQQANQKNSSSNDDDMMFFIGFFLLVTGIVYLFNRLEILNFLYYLTVFIVSLWSGGILHSLFKGKFAGWRWFANLAFYGVFFIVTFHIVNKAITPNFAPTNFKFSQQIINAYGLLGLSDYFSFLDFKWFIFHLLGVLLLSFSMIRLSLSTTYFAVMGNYITSNDEQEPWLAKRTRKYANFWRNIVYLSICLFISYYLIAGDFFMWFEYQFPQEMEIFINKVLHGS
ncbi:hypothetical protein RUK22_003387 [Vibrio cholerae]|uniref:hypothetical protein n=1 Tax=Vibrio cholerae TaxID=666 RepID=UPI00037FD0F8|nr:hypothetical protein [Vibrio cholerae]EGQ7979687.1 hypothetical protein [Vibrio cholerae]EGQ8531287.1 hypothetical protein [Vibrio cholerae]EGQ8559049.1 hypothetical protein [Vibrio cholerae]EGR0443693.1 hypothetical protein [Vibrio cholerae]EGR0452351.1 hypothetical protein [Vibrio cholerae]